MYIQITQHDMDAQSQNSGKQHFYDPAHSLQKFGTDLMVRQARMNGWPSGGLC